MTDRFVFADVIFYLLPDGRQEVRSLLMKGEDKTFFEDNSLDLTAEYLTTGELVIYCTVGINDPEVGEIEEACILQGDDCVIEGFSKLRRQAKETNPKLIG